jgi:hypothetical protein
MYAIGRCIRPCRIPVLGLNSLPHQSALIRTSALERIETPAELSLARGLELHCHTLQRSLDAFGADAGRELVAHLFQAVENPLECGPVCCRQSCLAIISTGRPASSSSHCPMDHMSGAFMRVVKC